MAITIPDDLEKHSSIIAPGWVFKIKGVPCECSRTADALADGTIVV